MRKSISRFVTSVAAFVMLAGSITGAAEKDIVDTAVEAGSFQTLAAAVTTAELVDALKSDGPFTVFAPTDEAFAKLPAGTVESLLMPENRDQLVAILKYHVVAGRVPAKQVVGLSGAVTLNGQRVDIAVEDGTVTVDNARVLKTDIECSNGLIHVIDSVILPAGDNLVRVAKDAGNFGTLLAAAKAAGLAEALAGDGPFTVFAPTDDAFAKLPDGTVEGLLKPENKDKLAAILKYHVVPGRIYSDAALAAGEAETLQGSVVEISAASGVAKVNDAGLVATDIDASNGVIHVIDSVLLPPAKSKTVSANEARDMIRHAVARGSHMFNTGHHASCAQLYMATMQQMVEYGDEMPTTIVEDMQHVMAAAKATHSPTQRSWTLRHGLDRVYLRMGQLR